MYFHHFRRNFSNNILRPKLIINIPFYCLKNKPDPLLSYRYRNYSFKGKLRWLARKKNILNMTNKEPLVWIDCEMTGLDIEKDHIIEVAVLITDGDLNIIAEGPDLVIHQSKEVMDGMGDWCKKHHGESGLTSAVLESSITTSEASKQIMEFLKKHIPEPKIAPLAGNSVHSDKVFLQKEMSEVINYLHYRIIDVSSIKELCKRWYPNIFRDAPQKKLIHRSLDDIKESITELKYYRQNIFIVNDDITNKKRKENP